VSKNAAPLALATTVNSAKTAKPIEMPFGEQTHVGARKCVLDGEGGCTLTPRGGEYANATDRSLRR